MTDAMNNVCLCIMIMQHVVVDAMAGKHLAYHHQSEGFGKARESYQIALTE